MINLMTPFWYDCPNPARYNELMDCLTKNSKSCFSVNSTANLVLFSEFTPEAHTSYREIRKQTAGYVGLAESSVRPTYQEFFNFSNQGKKDLYILANSDILIEPDVLKELDEYVTSNMFLCLTRWVPSPYEDLWSLDPMGKFCQDTWVWRGHCRIKNANFPLGIPRCDHMIAKAAVNESYDVLNPSLDIVTKHMHNVDYRSYTDKDVVHGIGAYVLPRRK
jgi:hypothetical protein